MECNNVRAVDKKLINWRGETQILTTWSLFMEARLNILMLGCNANAENYVTQAAAGCRQFVIH